MPDNMLLGDLTPNAVTTSLSGVTLPTSSFPGRMWSGALPSEPVLLDANYTPTSGDVGRIRDEVRAMQAEMFFTTPFSLQVNVPNLAGNYDYAIPYGLRITDVVIHKIGDGGVGDSVVLKNGTTAFTDTVSLDAVDGVLARVSTIDTDHNLFVAGDVLRVTVAKSSNTLATMYVTGMRVMRPPPGVLPPLGPLTSPVTLVEDDLPVLAGLTFTADKTKYKQDSVTVGGNTYQGIYCEGTFSVPAPSVRGLYQFQWIARNDANPANDAVDAGPNLLGVEITGAASGTWSRLLLKGREVNGAPVTGIAPGTYSYKTAILVLDKDNNVIGYVGLKLPDITIR